MKIEKISENQIKCTLTKNELDSRELKVSELAYGTAKAQMLLRDMMQQAAREIDFHAEDYPLMIEAIPSSGDNLVLIVTKVEDTKALDPHISVIHAESSETDIHPELEDEEYLDDMENIESDSESNATSLLEMFHQVRDKLDSLANGKDYIPLTDIIAAANKAKADALAAKEEAEKNVTRIFSFPELKTVVLVSSLIAGQYQGHSSLYKSDSNSQYYLFMDKSSHTVSEFDALCSAVSEFGTPENSSPVSEAYYKEHLRPVIDKDALQKLLLLQED